MKVLFIGLNWLGDVIMSLPTMLGIAAEHEVHVLTRPHLAEIYKLTESFAEIHQVAGKGPMLSDLQKLRRLKDEGFGQIIVLPDSIRAAIIAWLCRAPSLGYNTQGRKMFLTRAINKPENFKQIHEAKLHFALAEAAHLVHEFSPLPQFAFNQETTAAVFNEFGLTPDKPFIMLAPGAAFGAAKRWPPQKFAELARLLEQQSPELQLIVTGSAGEIEITAEVAAANKNARCLAGKTSLIQLAVLLSQAKALVANDSGTMHLAAMFATPALIPVGPTDMQRTGSLSDQARYFYGSEKCPQAPCRLKVCPREDHICMQSIDAADIAAALAELGAGLQ